MVQRVQRGHVFEVKNANGKVVSFHLRYRIVEMRNSKAVRVLKSRKLVDKSDKYFSASCEAVQDKCDNFMRSINAVNGEDQPIVTFWDQTYLPFIEENKKASTIRGYKQIWEQHLKPHFAGKTLQEYRAHIGSQFMLSLTKAQGRHTLNHIRSLASGIFSCAVNMGLLDSNPWHDVKILGKVKTPKPTEHYTLEAAEDIISALIHHVDCQLIMALACFLGLRPGEIAGLKWEDFDSNSVHIRRAIWEGIEGTTKTPESVASLPLPNRVALFVELWRQKSGNPSEGWVFPNGNAKPADLKDIVRRIIRPTVEAAGLKWKGLYSGRRGAGTAIIGLTGGNYAAAQELLRHKHMSTTLQFYKKQTQSALSDGIKALETALQPKPLA